MLHHIMLAGLALLLAGPAMAQSSPCGLIRDSVNADSILTHPAEVNLTHLGPVCVVDAGSKSGGGTFPSKANGSIWGSILAGGIIGYAIDASSGAGFDYPPNMTAIMSPPCPGK